MKRSPSRVRGTRPWLLPALATGLLVGMAFPPIGASWLAWVGLIPLLWAVRHEKRGSRAFRMGLLAGTVVHLTTLHPLVSAHLWSGWQLVPAAELAGIQNRQLVVLNGLWLLLSAWGGVFWGAFALALCKLGRGSLNRMAVLAPPLVVLLVEWLRSLTTWGFHWAFLGQATIELRGVLQLGALGGVWLLTWLVVLVNIGGLALLSRGKRPRKWALPVGITALVTAVSLAGSWRADSLRERLSRGDGVLAAAVQFYRPQDTLRDFTPLGLDRTYLDLLQRVARGDAGAVELAVFPETIAYTTLSLDGSRAPRKPDAVYRSRDEWREAIAPAMQQSGSRRLALVFGLDTVELGALHNSLAFWTRSGLRGWYHKQRPVPFAEYQPAVLGLLGLRGGPQYEAGHRSRVVGLHGIRIGGFICQEVLTPGILRRSTRDGAELLVSGGNDGVFANPAVARVHARLARLRAVETGRYVVRAMKTGISAIIAPTGEELARSPLAPKPFIVVHRVKPLDGRTPYVRFGDWPVAIAALLVLGALVGHVREAPSVASVARSECRSTPEAGEEKGRAEREG